jgi:cold shock protein
MRPEPAADPSGALGSKDTAIGTVKWWRAAKGYGAISTVETAPWDVWCHFSALDAPGFRALEAGDVVEIQYVRFDQNSFKYRALRVRRLEV